MKTKHLPLVVFTVCLLSLSTVGQTPVVINDPASQSAKMEQSAIDAAKIVLSPTEQGLMDKSILPRVREKLKSESCEESIEVSGRVQGAFTKAGSKQSLIFYQFCQTGNGLGSVGVAIMENGRVTGNYVAADAGWSVDAKALPDIDQNGFDEVALYYSGGMHQGAGGTGVDILEFSPGRAKGIGWYQAEGFTETSPVFGYRVTVNPGKTPAFFREKYIQNSAGKWRKTGKITPLKLGKIIGEFEAVK